MKILRNEKGIALVMTMVIALIGLGVVSVLLFLVIQGTSMSGYHRFFRTADEAAVGGADVAAEFIRDRGFAVPNLLNPQRVNGSPEDAAYAASCLNNKLITARGGANLLAAGAWVNCTSGALTANPGTRPDLQFDTPSVTGLASYRVFVKIVDTVAGNSETTGIVTVGELYGAGVIASSSGEVSPPHIPYLYRVEVQAQDAINPRERARYTGLYVY